MRDGILLKLVNQMESRIEDQRLIIELFQAEKKKYQEFSDDHNLLMEKMRNTGSETSSDKKTVECAEKTCKESK